MSTIKYSKESLEQIVKESYSIFEVMRKLGIKLAGGNHSHIKKRIISYNINTSHFTGQAYNRGKISSNKLSSNDVLIYDRNNGRRESVARLKRAMIECGIEDKCEQCGLEPIWNNKPITLEIDHKDGNGVNNTKENLRFLCPNCHSQTANYGAKNISSAPK